MANNKSGKKFQFKCDANGDFPAPYVTFNPDMLESRRWTHQDLVKLAVKLKIPYDGPREVVVKRLKDWHKFQFNRDRRAPGSNFSLLEVEMPPTPPKTAENEGVNAARRGISPSLLSPLKAKPRRNIDGTPISILSTSKKNRTVSMFGATSASGFHSLSPPRDSQQNGGSTLTRSEKKRIKFSIFNGTRIIPPREAIYRQWMIEAGLDPDSYPTCDSLSPPASDGPSSPIHAHAHAQAIALAQQQAHAQAQAQAQALIAQNTQNTQNANTARDQSYARSPRQNDLNSPPHQRRRTQRVLEFDDMEIDMDADPNDIAASLSTSGSQMLAPFSPTINRTSVASSLTSLPNPTVNTSTTSRPVNSTSSLTYSRPMSVRRSMDSAMTIANNVAQRIDFDAVDDENTTNVRKTSTQVPAQRLSMQTMPQLSANVQTQPVPQPRRSAPAISAMSASTSTSSHTSSSVLPNRSKPLNYTNVAVPASPVMRRSINNLGLSPSNYTQSSQARMFGQAASSRSNSLAHQSAFNNGGNAVVMPSTTNSVTKTSSTFSSNTPMSIRNGMTSPRATVLPTMLSPRQLADVMQYSNSLEKETGSVNVIIGEDESRDAIENELELSQGLLDITF